MRRKPALPIVQLDGPALPRPFLVGLIWSEWQVDGVLLRGESHQAQRSMQN